MAVDEYDGHERRSTGELGRAVDRLSYTVEKLDDTIDKLREDTVTRREFDELKSSLAWTRRTLIAGPGLVIFSYFFYRLFSAAGVAGP